jgi:hypothetical protein
MRAGISGIIRPLAALRDNPRLPEAMRERIARHLREATMLSARR